MTHTSNTYIDDLLDMSDPVVSSATSEIISSFEGCNILITGGSGFLGILLIEKLLRCCPDIGKLYLFMRVKKGKLAEQRFAEHFNDVVYDRLKKEQPNFMTKVIMIEADLKELDLGLSPENKERLLDTNIIFHAAATVRFNETLRNAVKINVNGTKQLVLFAKKLSNLKAFVHISTAYAHCVNAFIEEKFYSSPLDADQILTLVDSFDDKILDQITPILIGKWPNTYVFTKAIAEDIVRQCSAEIPICIVRPAIITSTANEPLTGWINNIYGAVGVVMGSGIGLLRTLHCNPDIIADIVPADYVVCNAIAAAWDTAKTKDTLLSTETENSKSPETKRLSVFNYISSRQNPITWRRFMKLNETYGLQVPTTNVLWYYMLFLNKYLLVHYICVIFLHMIPAAIVDTLFFLTGRKPILWKAYKKINLFGSILSYFTTQQWQFNNDAVLELWNRMNPTDREIFYFNIEDIDWEIYLKNMIPGMRLYLAHESLDTMDVAKARYRKLKVAHYTLLTISAILLTWGFVRLIMYIMSFF
ncbi:fatty acyl-CoA reductase wat-like [Linepithema humile]|uniref:fatty acyl-CoA reductase wat-like n=1 Tax=Linepithema humile TaxID=83485 RepID=UPI0006238348|nr:PREDICTED: fatty acyl-CoA reductase 1-like isoform X2 [Linepithema humile]